MEGERTRHLLADFSLFAKEILAAAILAALAWIAWRQREGDRERASQGMQLHAIQRDVQVVKAMGNSVPGKAMAAEKALKGHDIGMANGEEACKIGNGHAKRS